ncbi:MAG: hypothetical protein WC829_03420 [Hyphomicrobium sp.]|jgi:hypothetical protein
MDPLTGARKPRWQYFLLDRFDNRLGPLDGVTGGTVEVVAQSRLGGSGDLNIDDRGQNIDWLKQRVQIVYDPGVPGVEAWPIATMLFTTPKMRQLEDRKEYAVDLLTKLQIVDQTGFDTEYSLEVGEPIIPAVVAIIQSVGETRIAATDLGAVTTVPLRWEAGVSKLTIINELLQAANYWSLWCDGSGQFRVQPYVAPTARPVVRVFEAGQASIHEPGWTLEQDHSAVPNKYVVRRDGDDETPAIVGVAVNMDPASMYSIPARDGLIVMAEVEVVSDIESQQAADDLAQRRLLDAMSPVAKLEVTHAIVPLNPNDRVKFIPRGYECDATVQRMKYDLAFDGQCDADWREVM